MGNWVSQSMQTVNKPPGIMWKVMMTPFLLSTEIKCLEYSLVAGFSGGNYKGSTSLSHPREIFNNKFTLLGRHHSEIWSLKQHLEGNVCDCLRGYIWKHRRKCFQIGFLPEMLSWIYENGFYLLIRKFAYQEIDLLLIELNNLPEIYSDNLLFWF